MNLSTTLLLLCAGHVSTKRCRGRVNVGRSCTTRCNFRTGEWVQDYCSMDRNPPPTWCYDENGFQYDCTTRPGRCYYYCQTDDNDEVLCTYEYKGELKMGEELPPEMGDCRNTSPCNATGKCDD